MEESGESGGGVKWRGAGGETNGGKETVEGVGGNQGIGTQNVSCELLYLP
jgi:hypothetical protein